MNKPEVVFIVGPTAAGKSELAVKIAKHLCSEVISADSMQIYRGMHIASAAPDKGETGGIRHNLIEFLPYGTAFTVVDYVDLARKEISRIIKEGKTPVVAGGTGLYINALVDNVSFLPIKTDRNLRERLSREYDQLGGEKMIDRLREIDPDEAEKLNFSDKRRIVRALEIYQTSGISKTEQNARSVLTPPEFEPVIIGITFADRQKLYERINARVDKMIERGLVNEAQSALKSGAQGGSVQAIGHKELFPYLRGEQTLEECVEALKRATRRYAKRQLTWFNRDSRINWLYRDETSDIYSSAIEIIEREETADA